MPIYEYECPGCLDSKEVLVRVVEKGKDYAPSCARCGLRYARIISKSNFQLKGTGWYATDYKGKK